MVQPPCLNFRVTTTDFCGCPNFRIITVKQFFFSHPSCCIKGFGIDSMPSAGQINTTEVPRHTTSPRFRVSSVSLNGSSGSVKEWVSKN